MTFKLSNRQKRLKTTGLFGKILVQSVHETTGEDFRQWLADLFHCSDSWEMKYTVSEFRYAFRQWVVEGVEVPESVPVSIAVRYWNRLSDLHAE